jgi:hypothetical protein
VDRIKINIDSLQEMKSKCFICSFEWFFEITIPTNSQQQQHQAAEEEEWSSSEEEDEDGGLAEKGRVNRRRAVEALHRLGLPLGGQSPTDTAAHGGHATTHHQQEATAAVEKPKKKQ